MNQEQNDSNSNNFNTQGNNGIPNNQPLNNNQSFNNTFNQGVQQNANVNQATFNQGVQQNAYVSQPTFNSQPQSTPNYQQPINQMNMQQTTPQPTNAFEGGNDINQNSNGKPPKKINLFLIIAIVFIVIVVGIGALLLFNKPSNQTDSNGQTNNNANVIYNDSSRNIKSTYTFDEATSKFAFKKYETTLIFQQKDNIKLSYIGFGIFNTVGFYYEKNDSTYFNFIFEESSSTNVNEFVNNFKNGVLGGGKRQLSFENINILESNDEYAFISCQETGNPSYNYYFAKQIGNKVFYALYNSISEVDDGETAGNQLAIGKGKSEMLIGFKELFSALSVDDNKEPYICDKIINVPVVLDKQIKNYEFINNIQIVHSKISTLYYRDYAKGSVTLYSPDNKRIELYYDAEQLYNKIGWDKNITSKIKYNEKDSSTKFGIEDNNITQIFNLSSTEKIDNEKNFNEYLNKFFN